MTRIVTAYECGAVVNPDTVTGQIEGGTIMALGGALFEQVILDHGTLASPSLAGYRVPRFSDVPDIDVVLVDRPDIAPAGLARRRSSRSRLRWPMRSLRPPASDCGRSRSSPAAACQADSEYRRETPLCLLPTGGKEMIIDVHAHYYPARYLELIGRPVFPVTQDEHEDDAQDEHVEPDIPGAGSAVRAHGGAVVLTATR